MAKIKPFKGIRYNEQYISDMTKVVAPPYDVISEEEQKKLYAMHPNNVIRLEYGEILPQDDGKDNRYTRSAEFFKQWLKSGILVQESKPAIYLYQQTFSMEDGRRLTRRGFISLVKLEEFSKGIILPHEYTLSKPKVDRLNLMRTCRANFSQIFSLYDDKNAIISELLQKVALRQPNVDFIDTNGIQQSLWIITERTELDIIETALQDERLYIADGHHRYETALIYRDEMRRLTGINDGNQPFDYVMMMLVALDDPGLVILPTHRMINNIKDLDIQRFLESIKEKFDLLTISLSTDNEVNETECILKQHENDEKPFFILYDGRNYYGLSLKDWSFIDTVLKYKSDAYRHLDVSVLHTLIIEHLLGIDETSLAEQSNIVYTRDIAEAIKYVKDGKAQLVFLLRPTKVEQIKKVALAGEKMPQKSTYFYPKLITGLVMNKL